MDVDAVSAVGSMLVAALAIAGNVWTTRASFRHHLALQRLALLDQRRATLYVRVLEACMEHEDWRDARAQLDLVAAEAQVFASPQVWTIVADLRALPDGFDVQEYDALTDRLVDAVRAEFDPDADRAGGALRSRRRT